MPFRRSKINHRHRDGHVLVWEQSQLQEQPRGKLDRIDISVRIRNIYSSMRSLGGSYRE